MKGIVFTEFLELVESRFSIDIADQVIEAAQSATGGAYTAVGTYDHAELVRMVVRLSEITGTSVPKLLYAFGEHLACRFAQLYPVFFKTAPDLFQFLASIDGHIHVEVRKLYPDAELPRFETVSRSDDAISLVYRSSRHMSDLAQGLIAGTAVHYGETVNVIVTATSDGGVRFDVSRVRQMAPQKHAVNH